MRWNNAKYHKRSSTFSTSDVRENQIKYVHEHCWFIYLRVIREAAEVSNHPFSNSNDSSRSAIHKYLHGTKRSSFCWPQLSIHSDLPVWDADWSAWSSSAWPSSWMACIDALPTRLFSLLSPKTLSEDLEKRRAYLGRTTLEAVTGLWASRSDITESDVCGLWMIRQISFFLRQILPYVGHRLDHMLATIFINCLNEIFEEAHFHFAFAYL